MTTIKQSNTSCWSWGANSHGQLGTGNQIDSLEPVEIILLQDHEISVLFAGGGHSIALTQKKNLLSFGWSSDGQLGIQQVSTENVVTPHFIEALFHKNIVKVSCGWSHTVAIDDNGHVFIWGSNQFGQLGISQSCSKVQNIPCQLSLPEKITEIACGLRHTLLLTSMSI
mmetsp:Transcript_12442/g.17224  ORF Transcript_12442/g.17224 Transcript_12442/m.17224 type:complete len:169 (+) Transcript_12442:135-641(+)